MTCAPMSLLLEAWERSDNQTLRAAFMDDARKLAAAGCDFFVCPDNTAHIALESAGDVTQLSALGRQIAMHIAALNPTAVDASGIDPQTVERESAILREKNAGKPDNVLGKIVESGLKSYYKEVTLLEQGFVHEPAKSVVQVLKEAEGRVGGPVKVVAFVRYALGEGIEKEETDFAAEVAAQSGVGKKLVGPSAIATP